MTRSKKTNPVNVYYLDTLRKCTKTVMDLYTKHIASFPEEYIALVSKTSVPNGTILCIPMNQPSDNIVFKILRYKKDSSEITYDGLLELVNAWVYLEEGQTQLEYLQLYFKYLIDNLGITKYRLKQMYQELELENDDDSVADPDYNPDLDNEDYYEELEYSEDYYSPATSDESSGSVDTLDIDTTEFEFKNQNEVSDSEDDSDKSPDYVPSVESEDEYENNHHSITVVTKKRNVRKTRMVHKTVH
jgi:hypothetical protein